MHKQFQALGWSEATIFDLSFIDGELQLKMHDILDCDELIKYEIVEVKVCQIEALHIEIIPFENDEYGSPEVPINFGTLDAETSGFEGVLLSNPFSESAAECYWVSSDFRANEISVCRTGKYVYKTRRP